MENYRLTKTDEMVTDDENSVIITQQELTSNTDLEESYRRAKQKHALFLDLEDNKDTWIPVSVRVWGGKEINTKAMWHNKTSILLDIAGGRVVATYSEIESIRVRFKHICYSNE